MSIRRPSPSPRRLDVLHDLSDASGISPRLVRRLLRGDTSAPLAAALRLTAALDLPLSTWWRQETRAPGRS